MLNKDKVYLACAPIAWTNDDLPDLGAENTFEHLPADRQRNGSGWLQGQRNRQQVS